jgi:thiol-disulfide isomerase/thioredoxin
MKARIMAGALMFLSAASVGLAAAEPAPSASDTKTNAADAAWKVFQKAATPLSPPGEWQVTRPSEEQIDQFHIAQAAHAGAAADSAKDFFTKFPNDPRATEARTNQLELLQIATRLGDTNRAAEVESLQAAKLKDPSLSEDDRFSIKMDSVQRRLGAKASARATDLPDAAADAAHGLIRDFPKRPEGYQLLMQAADISSDAKQQKLWAGEVAESAAAPDEVKTAAKGQLKKLDALGKPVPISFTAVDGRKVDVASLSNKVVMIDFWATWCGPCVHELPEVKEAYDKLNSKGFEVVGISLDKDRDTLEKFLADKQMPWPQYFDGKVWQNDIAREYGINSIPAMWLIDKSGNLRDMNPRGDLAAKVQKLLAE